MATIELGPGGHYADPVLGARGAGLRRVLLPAVRWGAVLAGVAVGVSVQLVLSLLGIATGLSAMDMSSQDGVNATAPLIWTAVSMLLSAFVGGYVAARMSGLKRKVDGLLHGAVSWAVTTLLFAMLASSVGGNLLAGIFSSMGPALTQAASGGSGPVATLLRSQVGNAFDPNTLQRLQQDIQAGRRDEAIARLANASGMATDRAASIVDQALILSGSPETASPAARQSAERALEAAGTTAWMVFLAVALSLAAGMLGGALGALGSRRTTWSGNAAERDAASPS